MRQVREIEERMCTSVYYMSQATRCERLALDLTARVYYGKISPPGSPPAGPYEPPPPPPPPLPALPDGLFSILPRTALLSTNRMPEEDVARATDDGFYTDDEAALAYTLALTPVDERACVEEAPLPCNTGSLPERCISAGRHCDTAEANGRDPYVEFTWPHMPDRYLWAIQLTLPPNEQLSRLMIGSKELRLYGERGEPVPCAEGDEEVFDVTTGETLTIVCQPGGWEAADLHALGGAHRARLTLTGDFRQLWLAHQGIHIVERTYAGAGVGRRPPPPPATPSLPPNPPAPELAWAGWQCSFEPRQYVPDEHVLKRRVEPCGLTTQECCDLMVAALMDAYEMDDAGCCLLLTVDGTPSALVAPHVPSALDARGNGYWSNTSGTGYGA
jgi:hypothetical protein